MNVGKSDGLLWIWSILCLIWWVAAGATTVGFIVIGAVWIGPAFMLTVIYLIARAGRRRCPVCGVTLAVGVTGCDACGHDFAAAHAVV